MASAAHADQLKIGMTFQEMNNPYFVSMQQALNDAAKALGATVIVTDARHDVAKQISDVEDMVQRKIDILLVNPTIFRWHSGRRRDRGQGRRDRRRG